MEVSSQRESAGGGDFLPPSQSPAKTLDASEWSPGIWSQFPWTAFTAILVCLLSMIAAAVMLYRSDGRPQSEWPVSPAVILAVCSAVGTTSLEMARSEGATISWWTRSLQGCTLRDLHCQWAISTGIWSSLLFWRQFSRNTLATIGVTLCLVVSPLLQRASVSDSARFSSPATVHLPAASTHSSYTTGASKSDEALDWSLDYAAVISEYLDRSPITTSPIHGCNEGTCTGNLTTVGITGSCPIHNTTTVDLVEELLIGEQSPHTKPKPSVMEIAVNFDNLGLDMSPWHGLFFIDATYFVPSHNHTVLRFSNGTSFFGCPGTMVTKRCSITPGLVEYPVSISNGSLTIRNEITGFFPSVSDSSFLGPNKTRTGRGKPIYDANSIGGILTAAKYIFDSQITISAMVETMLTNHTRDVTVQPTFTGRMAARYMQLPSWGTQSCVINMPDPTSGILSVLNGLMFRTGLAAGRVSPFPVQTIDAQQSVHTLVYRVKWEFFALAVALMVLCIILVAGSLSSWWRLGRAVSMSPVEIAKALDSSLMQDDTISYAPLDTLIEHVGDIPVKYGVTRETEVIDHIPVVKRQVLRFGDPDIVHDL